MWINGTADEIGHTAAGNLVSGVKSGSETIHFIHMSHIPRGKNATYTSRLSSSTNLTRKSNNVQDSLQEASKVFTLARTAAPNQPT